MSPFTGVVSWRRGLFPRSFHRNEKPRFLGVSRGGASPTAFKSDLSAGFLGLLDGLLDLGEVRHRGGVALHFGVDDVASLVRHEDGALGDVEEASLFRDDLGVLHLEGLDGHAVEVGNEGQGDASLLSPSFLGERGIDRDGDDVGAELLVLVEQAGDLAELVGAHARKGEGDEEDDGLALADVAAEADVSETCIGLLLEGDFRERLADFEGHGCRGGLRAPNLSDF